MADTFDRLKSALADRYAIEEPSDVGRLTTAKALGELVASATVSWPSREFTRGNNRSVARPPRASQPADS